MQARDRRMTSTNEAESLMSMSGSDAHRRHRTFVQVHFGVSQHTHALEEQCVSVGTFLRIQWLRRGHVDRLAV
jgi:hypothetical protein